MALTYSHGNSIFFPSTFVGSNCTGMSVAVTELIDLHRIMEGLLFDTEVVAGPDNFGHACSS